MVDGFWARSRTWMEMMWASREDVGRGISAAAAVSTTLKVSSAFLQEFSVLTAASCVSVCGCVYVCAHVCAHMCAVVVSFGSIINDHKLGGLKQQKVSHFWRLEV